MNIHSLLLLIIIFTFLTFQSHAYTNTGYYILDLETTDLSSEAGSWTLSSSVSSTKTFTTTVWKDMPSKVILGGPNILGSGSTYQQYFERTYTGISPHTFIGFTLTIWYFDDWRNYDNAQAVKFYFDGTLVNGPTISWWKDFYAFEGGSNVQDYSNSVVIPGWDCGFNHIKSGVSHTGSTLTFRVVSLSDSDTVRRSFGFRDLSLVFSNYTQAAPTTCHISEEVYLHNANSLYNTPCPCNMDQAKDASGTCKTCADRCSFCFGADISQCLKCDSGLAWTGNDCCHPYCTVCTGATQNSCLECGASYYNSLDGTCSAACNSPKVGFSLQGNLYCINSCGSGFIFTANISCVATCNSPLIVTSDANGVKFCSNPCTNSGDYLFPDGTCAATCPSPLISRTEPGVKYCFSPCQNPTDFLYSNGSCFSGCPSPLQDQIGYNIQWCINPCSDPSNQYLYPNKSCIATCPSPLVSRSEPGVKYCWNPCQNAADFLYSNGSCFSTCPSPLVSRAEPNANYCWNPCQNQADFLFPNGSCFFTCPSPLVSRFEPGAKFCWNPCVDKTNFLYTNGSCFATCPHPLISRSEPGVAYCFTPCPNPTTDYLYPNGSCFSTCPAPLVHRAEPNANYCWNPCQNQADFLFTNGSCFSTCPSPLISRSEPGVTYCFTPCPNPTTDYLYPNGSCSSSCPPPLVSRSEPGANYCWNPCLNPTTDFLYTNGSCFETCPLPLVNMSEPGVNYCFNPCSSPATDFLYANGTCKSDCPGSFLTISNPGVNYCFNICPEPTTDYLYPNKTCSSHCLSPLISTTYSDINFCENPCNTPSDFLYPNGSCFSTCPSPLSYRIEPIANFCYNPCSSPDNYLYSNGSCQSTCPAPLINRTEPDVTYCLNPCSAPNIYLYANNSCLQSCNFPYQITITNNVSQCLSPCKSPGQYYYETEKVCRSVCSSPYEIIKVDSFVKICHLSTDLTLSEVDKVKSTADSIASQGAATSTGMKASAALSSNSPNAALLAGLSSMLMYIRYMNINYPPKVQILFMTSAADPISISFGVNMPSFIEENLADNPLPYVFEKYDINSNFVHNMWDSVMSFVLSVLLVGVIFILKVATKRLTKIHMVFSKLLEITKWNIPLMMLCSCCGDIFFYGSLQFRTSDFHSTSSILCFVVAGIMIIFAIAVFLLTANIAFQFKKLRNRRGVIDPIRLKNERERWKDYEILFIGYEETSFWSLAYMSLFILRAIIFNFTIANLFNYPLIQAIMINFFNIFMFIYLVTLRPLKDLLNLAQLFINEVLVDIVSISVFILAVMDKCGIQGTNTRASLGSAIIVVAQTFNTFGLVFLGLQLLICLVFVYRGYKRFRAKGIKSPIKILKAIFLTELGMEKKQNNMKSQELLTSLGNKIGKRNKILRPPRRNKRLGSVELNIFPPPVINYADLIQNASQNPLHDETASTNFGNYSTFLSVLEKSTTVFSDITLINNISMNTLNDSEASWRSFNNMLRIPSSLRSSAQVNKSENDDMEIISLADNTTHVSEGGENNVLNKWNRRLLRVKRLFKKLQ